MLSAQTRPPGPVHLILSLLTCALWALGLGRVPPCPYGRATQGSVVGPATHTWPWAGKGVGVSVYTMTGGRPCRGRRQELDPRGHHVARGQVSLGQPSLLPSGQATAYRSD